MLSKNIPWDSDITHSILEYVNNHLLDDTIVDNKWITEILEVTYSYDDIVEGHSWNKTLFWEFWWCNINTPLTEVGEKVESKLKTKIQIIDEALKKINDFIEHKKDFDSSENSENSKHIRLGLLKESLEFSRRCFEITLIWLPFELEKAWFTHTLSDEEIRDRIAKMEKLEKQNFWGNVRDNQEEVVACYENMRWYFESKKDTFSPEEQTRYLWYIQKVETYLPKNYIYEAPSPKKKQDYFSPEMKEILQKEVWRDIYAQDFETILNIFLWLDFEVKVEEWRGSIYDGPWYIAIPKSENYKIKSVWQILKWVVHELESHSTNFRTNQNILWNFRGTWSVEKEEALAMISEKFLMWEDLNDVGITQHFPKVLMWELLDAQELEDFLALHSNLQADTATPQKRMLRVKRNYPLWYPWAQHKDTSYSRWVLELKSFLQNDGDIRDYFVWKVGVKDIPKVKKIIKLDWLDWDIQNPLMIAEMLLFYLFPKDQRPEKDFLSYIKKKYPFLNLKDEEIKLLSYSQKKQVVDILWHLRDKYQQRNINTQEKLWVKTIKVSEV